MAIFADDAWKFRIVGIEKDEDFVRREDCSLRANMAGSSRKRGVISAFLEWSKIGASEPDVLKA